MSVARSSIFLIILAFSTNLVANSNDSVKGEVSVVLSSNTKTKDAFFPILRKFTEETGVKVKILGLTKNNQTVHSNQGWLTFSSKGQPDVIYTHGGMRLADRVKAGEVHVLSELWKRENLAEQFHKSLISHVSYQNEVYALPYSFNSWGFFYHQSLVNRFGPVPAEWPEFINYCLIIKDSGLPVFPATIKQPYVLSGWLEYFILRTYGLDVFNQYMRGELSFLDPKMIHVFQIWQDMLNKGLFAHDQFDERWEAYLPLFLRKKIAFVFLANNMQNRINNPNVLSSLRYTAFPMLRNIPKYETAPTEVLYIRKQSPHIEEAEKLLTYLARSDVQSALAESLKAFPANKYSEGAKHKLARTGQQVVKRAEGFTPFFDRGADGEFQNKVLPLLVEFMKTADVGKVTKKLEDVRLKVYPSK